MHRTLCTCVTAAGAWARWQPAGTLGPHAPFRAHPVPVSSCWCLARARLGGGQAPALKHRPAVAVVAVAPLERACSRNKVAPAGSNGVKADQVCFKERGKTELHKRNGKIWNLCQSPPRLPNCRESRNNGGEDRFLRFLPTMVKNEHDKLLAVPVLRSVITLGHGSRDFETPALNHKPALHAARSDLGMPGQDRLHGIIQGFDIQETFRGPFE